MTTGNTQVEAIQEDLQCPGCEYNLRGLTGAVVNCPECGLSCDVARLIAQRWTGPWYNAPGFSALVYTVGATLLMLLSMGLLRVDADVASGCGLMLLGLGVIGWVVYVLRIIELGFVGERLKLVLMAHVLFAGNLTAMVVVPFAIYRAMSPQTELWTVLTFVVAGAVAVGLLVLLRRGERFIAERCINLHLRKQGAHGPEA